MKIAILGFGNIGTAFYAEIVRNYPDIEVTRILLKDRYKKREMPEGVKYPEKIITTEYSEILNDKSIETVVDITAGPGSLDYLKRALEAGKNAVTANKLAVSEKGPEFLNIAREKKVNFYFEACVGGGIPVINLFNENIKIHRINKVAGIVNGTTNYILTQMADNDMEFSDALKLAQEKGFAEPDPTFDISGRDSAYKISILKDLLFNAEISANNIFCQGIEKIGKIDLEYARSIKYQIKLIGYIESTPEGIDIGVRPVFLHGDHPLAQVKNEFNAIFIEGSPIGEVMLFGRGAGQGPTTASLISDVLRIKRNPDGPFNDAYGKNGVKTDLIPESQKTQSNYFRFKVTDVPGVITKITALFEKYQISISSMKQEVSHEKMPVDIIFTTHVTKTQFIPEMLQKIRDFDFVIAEPIWYKIDL